ncbi:hypothetical protein [Halobacillus litoralis]|uniref:DUF2524 domain-containing protein n=1 Tax=Halobacillus litoralis TaxID=45668 RepID=A0A410MJH0_9BACI|nr:hypothetical protein [Halobacillus litoralis]QAS54805.1 hypothetical protein HLI_21355 [Halobacillus litoralis]
MSGYENQIDTLTRRYTELRKELNRFTCKLDHVDEQDIELYQDVCMLFATQLNRLRKECNASYSIDVCQENLDK